MLIIQQISLRRNRVNEYEGHWITTYTGGKFHYLEPSPDEIHIEDIAHHLSLLCRFTGACKSFYSVAEHSMRVARLLPPELKLAGLLHDASEAYLNDISRPVKYSHKLHETEQLISKVVADKFSVDIFHPEVKKADDTLIATEARDLMPNTDTWAKLPDPLVSIIVPISPTTAEMYFHMRFKEYGGHTGI